MKIIIVVILSTLFISGCITNNDNKNNTDTNSVTNATIQPNYPHFIPWWTSK